MNARRLAVTQGQPATLPSERALALLVIINGDPEPGELEGALAVSGFDGIAVAWEEDGAPLGWPEEPEVTIAANETYARVRGTLRGGALTIPADAPLEHGTVTVAAAWDEGPAVAAAAAAPTRATRVGDSPPAATPNTNAQTAALATAAVLAGVFLWQHMGQESALDRERTRLANAAARAEAYRVRARTSELVAKGVPRLDAEAIAEMEGAGFAAAGLERAAEDAAAAAAASEGE